MVALSELEIAPVLLARCRAGLADRAASASSCCRASASSSSRATSRPRPPLAAGERRTDWSVLIEANTSTTAFDLRSAMEQCLGAKRSKHGESRDAAVPRARSTVAETLWRQREALLEGQIKIGAGIKHDVSVPVAQVPAFIKPGIAAWWPPGRRRACWRSAISATATSTSTCMSSGRGQGALHRPHRGREPASVVHDVVPRFGGIVQRRARHRPAAPQRDAALQGSGRARPHAAGQAPARSAGDHEPGSRAASADFAGGLIGAAGPGSGRRLPRGGAGAAPPLRVRLPRGRRRGLAHRGAQRARVRADRFRARGAGRRVGRRHRRHRARSAARLAARGRADRAERPLSAPGRGKARRRRRPGGCSVRAVDGVDLADRAGARRDPRTALAAALRPERSPHRRALAEAGGRARRLGRDAHRRHAGGRRARPLSAQRLRAAAALDGAAAGTSRAIRAGASAPACTACRRW